MPIKQTIKVNPLDLDNRGIGVSLPFNANGIFVKTYSTKDQVKANLINLLLTYKGERIYNPEFGADLPRLLFEPLTQELYSKIVENITRSVFEFIPQIELTQVNLTPDEDRSTIYVNIVYYLKTSGTLDEITIQI